MIIASSHILERRRGKERKGNYSSRQGIKKMVPGFKRSISLPMSPRRKSAPEKPYRHARSVSLPCPSHPLLSHLDDAIRTVRRWAAEPDRAPARISTGLGRIGLLLAALGELLRLPQAEDALRRAGAADPLLDDLLRLADAYGSLRSAALLIKETQSETRAALRRRDAARLASSLGSQRRAEKELARIASAVRPPASRPASGTEIEGIVGDAMAAISAASVAVVLGIAAISAAAAASTARSSSVLEPLRKLGFRSSSSNKKATAEEKEIAASERLEELEECVGELESGSEMVFRSLVNTRVSLLNILTPSF